MGAALLNSVSQAMRITARMDDQSAFSDVTWRQESRKAPSDLLHGRMAARVSAHLEVFRDPDWRKASRTTNAVERCFAEVRRRTRPMGVMADRTSCERIVYAVFMGINQSQGTASPFPLTQNP